MENGEFAGFLINGRNIKFDDYYASLCFVFNYQYFLTFSWQSLKLD
ncbi:hypothetical protein GAPWK_1604 [Gilliamella apicola]|nr:hypothetical protein GAPWK_1604 [Gilliamella apicola]